MEDSRGTWLVKSWLLRIYNLCFVIGPRRDYDVLYTQAVIGGYTRGIPGGMTGGRPTPNNVRKEFLSL